jgi:hypothetical protein
MHQNSLLAPQSRRWLNSLSAAGCLLVLLVLVGCGRKGPEVVPVEGTITFGGGAWPKPGVLYFTVDAPAAGMPNRPAMAKFNTDGKLTVTTFHNGDGLIPGKYKMGVECWEVPPSMEAPTKAKSYVPKRYQAANSSGLSVTVEPGQSVLKLNLDIPKK